MKTLILDGSHANDPMAVRLNAVLQNNLEMRGWSFETIVLRDKKIGNCAGDFFCWIRTPGICNVEDDNRDIAAKVLENDLVIYLSPVTFGGYSSALKSMQDHQIQNVLPFFTTIEGETHHQKRYPTYPKVLTLGWLTAPNAVAEAIFRNLAYRNSLNMHSGSSVCGILYSDQNDDELALSLNEWLENTKRGLKIPRPELPEMSVATVDTEPVRRAVLLVGSPRTRKSTSASLGGYLFEQLSARGVEIETIHLHTSLNSPERTEKLYATLDTADLVVLAFPLYVDSLPALVIKTLERISGHCAGNSSHTRFAAIANCGFPEAHHNDTAIAICAEFARSAGFKWMGSLTLGGGEGLVHGTPLNELDGRAIPIKQSLEMAAETLAAGQPIPKSSRDLLARPVTPNWIYRVFGTYGWRQQAKRYGAHNHLRSRPYQ